MLPALAIGLLLLAPAIAQDDDGDGLSGEQEAILGTDPTLKDTDGDGLMDGEEYFSYFTNPLEADTDGDGLSDSEDPYPYFLHYKDLGAGVTTLEDRILQGEGGMQLHQLVQVKVGNVITIDWTNFLRDFSLWETEFTISFDFLDPEREDYTGDGHYRRVGGEEQLMEIRLPSYEGIVEAVIPWQDPAMTPSDWIYHLHSKPIESGQHWEFSVFYHELFRWGEDPFFSVEAEVLSVVPFPLETRLGRREYQAYEIRAVFKHTTFKDPVFKTLLGEDPELVLRAFITAGDGPPVTLRYTTPFFRITPTKSVGFSDFLVQR
jgi:hypothetical protein